MNNNVMTAEVLSSSRNIAHPQFSINSGKVIATVLMAFMEAMKGYSDPTTMMMDMNQFVMGFTAIWLAPAPTPTPVA